MSPRRPLLAALCLAAVLPGSAWAQDVRVAERDEPLAAVRSSLVRAAPLDFTMVGLHWRGPGRVWFRTAPAAGAWSSWQPARPEDEDRPDRSSPEAAASAGWEIGNPWWTGPARRIQYRVSGRVDRLRTFFLWSPVTEADRSRAARLAAAGAAGDALAGAAIAARPEQPAIVRRSAWGADESIVRAPPSYAERVRFSIVHHTAGTNSYGPAQSAAIVRGIQRYHVLSNGWNDIGYNFLVDKYGQVFEGRAGGLGRNVVGAHAEGFNTGSTGVAVLGTYSSARISRAARRALQRLLAWRLDVAHVDPVALVDATSYGNPRFPAGQEIRLRAVSGHRDTGYTSCPGTALYGQLGTIARNVGRIGLPKLYDPEVTGAVGGPVRFTARLSTALPWVVAVKDGTGAVVAEGRGSGTAVDWTWDASAAPLVSYTYSMEAGDDVRPAAGAVPAPPPLAVRGLDARPGVITPNGDGVAERTTVVFTLSRSATVRVRVVEASSGAAVRTLLARGARPGGPFSLRWGGSTGAGDPVPDGRYRVEVSAESGSEQVTRSTPVTVDRTLGSLTVSPGAFSPNGDGRLDSAAIGFALTRPADVRVRIRPAGESAPVRSVLTGALAAGEQAAAWDGRLADGARAPDGPYEAVVRATTSLGTRTLVRPVVVDTSPPRVRIVRLRTVDGITRVRFTLGEPAHVRVWLGQGDWRDGVLVEREREAGPNVVRYRLRADVVRIVATDAAGNRSPGVVFRAS